MHNEFTKSVSEVIKTIVSENVSQRRLAIFLYNKNFIQVSARSSAVCHHKLIRSCSAQPLWVSDATNCLGGALLIKLLLIIMVFLKQVPKEIEHTEMHDKEFGQLEKENSEVIEELQLWIDDGDQKNEALEQVLEKTNEENVNLLVQISVMQKELKDLERKNDSLQTELETKRVDMKRLSKNQYYMERELRNLKRDLKRKEQNLEELERNLNTALMEKQELSEDVDYLDSCLKNNQAANEQLNAQVDELNEMVKELNKGPYYVHFCAEEKLLKGSLDLAARPEALAPGEALEKISLSRVIVQLEEQMATFEEENARILSEKEKELNDMKYETARFIQELEDQLAKLRNENYSMSAELSRKDKQLCDLRLQVENQNEFIQNKLNMAYCSLSERNLEIDHEELQHEKSNKDFLNVALELAVNNYVVNEKVHSTKTRELEIELATMKRLSREAQTYKVVYLSLCQRLAFLVNKNGFCSDANNKN